MTNTQLTLALAGNPNSGKTTIFNNLTGSNQHVGNYPGVTVEKREGFRKYQDKEFIVVDLPGTYGLMAHSADELVARSFIVHDKPDIIVNIVDATNLERNLYLTLQLLELERPVIIALNMVDVADGKGIQIDDRLLAQALQTPVVRSVGRQNQGTEDILAVAAATAEHSQPCRFTLLYGSKIEEALDRIIDLLSQIRTGLRFPRRWLALKLLEGDTEASKYLSGIQGSELAIATASLFRQELFEELGDPALLIAEQRHRFVAAVYAHSVTIHEDEEMTTSDKLDLVLTGRFSGLPIFLGLMWLLFNMVFTVGAYPQAWIEDSVGSLAQFVSEYLTDGELRSFIVDGIFGGVGSVIVFLPNILILFLGIAFMEDTGYMARAAFIMDRIMRAVGLHGKSFIPLLLGFGCSVPAIMGTRSLESPRDRLVTILVAPFMSCSAKLPVYTVLIGAFFDETVAGTVLFSIYFLGILLAVMVARVFRTLIFRGESDPFVMEMPPYRRPTIKSMVIHMWERSLLYLRKAGTIILSVSILVWFLVNYPTADPIAQSYAGQLGKLVEPLIAPLGFDWKLGVGLVSAFTAKEVLISTLGTIYHVDQTGETAVALQEAIGNDPSFRPLIAYSLMIFVLVYSPCLAAIAVIKRETNSWKWALFSPVYSTVLAWILSFIVFQVGTLLGY
ncbi:ferrous iron transport protein B [Sporomusa malonica]|uniref:Ferrous iron transport protein B n=1 Tax=Sporomusa malonica TaxID=112901 RepID=A0A1W2EK46_9FIRM|nr:ferrous iron transport protein B [Sporomusa malonica]SMD09882.1 ferrous iron transport protein B [Sporomusa malonica]